MVKLSIIIPTLNEEEYLERLLKSIKKQDFKEYEIIVSDSKSEDNTIKVAKKYGAKIVIGEKKGPGHGRNMGVKKSKGKYLLFIDADVILPDKKTFTKAIKALKNETFAGGVAISYGCDGNFIHNLMVTVGLKFYESLVKLNIPIAPGFFMFTRKELFEKVGGFDEELPVGEDLKFLKSICSYGKPKLLNCKIKISSRRLSEGGLLKTIKDYFPTTIAYFLNEDYSKKNFKFEAASEIKNKKR